MPIITPASTPNTRVPTIAAIGDPEVEPLDPGEPPHLGDVHHAHHDRLDDERREHGLGEVGEQRCQNKQSQQDRDARGERGEPGAGTGVVVQRARRQARRDRHALEQAGARVRHGLRDRLLVDVDLVAMLGRERAGVAGGLREPDQHQRDRRDRDGGGVVPHQSAVGDLERRQSAGHVADQGHARGRRGRAARRRAARRRRGPARRGPGGRRAAARRRRRSATTPTTTVACSRSPSVPSQDHSSCSGLVPLDLGAGELGELTDHHVDRRAEQEAGDHGPREELGDPAHPEHRQKQEQDAGCQGDAARRRTRRPARR